jgi:hypothetical protein
MTFPNTPDVAIYRRFQTGRESFERIRSVLPFRIGLPRAFQILFLLHRVQGTDPYTCALGTRNTRERSIALRLSASVEACNLARRLAN